MSRKRRKAMSDSRIDRAEEAEAEALERHDREHPGDPKQWWGECRICAERMAENEESMRLDKAIEAGVDDWQERKNSGGNYA
jgi:hypothetical protein